MRSSKEPRSVYDWILPLASPMKTSRCGQTARYEATCLCLGVRTRSNSRRASPESCESAGEYLWSETFKGSARTGVSDFAIGSSAAPAQSPRTCRRSAASNWNGSDALRTWQYSQLMPRKSLMREIQTAFSTQSMLWPGPKTFFQREPCRLHTRNTLR